MKIVISNAHCNNGLAKPLFYFFVKRPCTYKQNFFLDYLVQEKKEFQIYVDGQKSSLPPFLKKIVPTTFEVYLWAIFNKINPFKIKIIKTLDNLTPQDLVYTPRISEIIRTDSYKNCKATKIIHATHFMYSIDYHAKNTEDYGVDFIICENNLAKNSPYFIKYFSWYQKDVYTIPFVFQKRFVNLKSFSERQNKTIATGTTVKVENKVFNDFFKFYYYHPMRQKIYENKNDLLDYIDSFIPEYFEQKIEQKNISIDDSKIKKIALKIHNRLVRTVFIHFSMNQSKYHKFNIVEKYNDYKMAIVPEEINNLPGIGFVECMACGCAYIGLDDPMYRDLGLIPGVHYISYDGSLDDLKRTITYYQNHNDELEKIANTGYLYVTENFNSKTVAEKFYQDLKNYALSENKPKNKLPNSFVK